MFFQILIPYLWPCTQHIWKSVCPRVERVPKATLSVFRAVGIQDCTLATLWMDLTRVILLGTEIDPNHRREVSGMTKYGQEEFCLELRGFSSLFLDTLDVIFRLMCITVCVISLHSSEGRSYILGEILAEISFSATVYFITAYTDRNKDTLCFIDINHINIAPFLKIKIICNSYSSFVCPLHKFFSFD